MANDSDEELLARNMVDVHGAEAATIAREDARGAASPGNRRKQSLGSGCSESSSGQQAALNHRQFGSLLTCQRSLPGEGQTGLIKARFR